MVDIPNMMLGGLGIPGVGQQGIPGVGDPLMDLLQKLGVSPQNMAQNMPLLQIAKGRPVGSSLVQGLKGGLGLPPGLL